MKSNSKIAFWLTAAWSLIGLFIFIVGIIGIAKYKDENLLIIHKITGNIIFSILALVLGGIVMVSFNYIVIWLYKHHGFKFKTMKIDQKDLIFYAILVILLMIGLVFAILTLVNLDHVRVVI